MTPLSPLGLRQRPRGRVKARSSAGPWASRRDFRVQDVYLAKQGGLQRLKPDHDIL